MFKEEIVPLPTESKPKSYTPLRTERASPMPSHVMAVPTPISKTIGPRSAIVALFFLFFPNNHAYILVFLSFFKSSF